MRKQELKQYHLNRQFFLAVLSGDIDKAEGARRAGADVNAIDALSKLAPIHAAVVTENLDVAKYLVERCDVNFGADGSGRWPTAMSFESKLGKFSDYILEAEANFDERHPEMSSGQNGTVNRYRPR